MFLNGWLSAQPQPFRENSRWGIQEGSRTIVPALFDTVFNFEASGRVCLTCYKSTGVSANKFIKIHTVSYACNYLNRAGKCLSVKAPGNDTCTVFSLSKHTARQLNEDPRYFVVSVKNKRILVDKDFNQITFQRYHEISFSPEPSYIITQVNENNSVLTGLINLKEELIVPYRYSEIKINTNDSVIIACSAGVKVNSEDDIYNYQGKKIGAYKKHVETATKNFVIHKLYEPKEQYVIYNIATKEEKELNADEVQIFNHDEVLIRIKNDWFIYDLQTNLKKPKQT